MEPVIERRSRQFEMSGESSEPPFVRAQFVGSGDHGAAWQVQSALYQQTADHRPGELPTVLRGDRADLIFQSPRFEEVESALQRRFFDSKNRC